MGTTKRGKANRATRAAELIAGTMKTFPDGTQVLAFAGRLATVTVDEARQQLQALVDNRAETTAAQATARDRVSAERAAAPALVAFMAAFEGLVRLMFAGDTTTLADFGLEPHRLRGPKTVEEIVVAAAKAKATRAARGTRGPKARRAVKGNVRVELVVTPLATTPAVRAEPPTIEPIDVPAAKPGT